MRILSIVSLLALSFATQADTVGGHCEGEGVRLNFTDGIAFADARSEAGAISTAIYLTVEKLDRAALTACPDCGGALPATRFASSRGYTVQKQTQKGWMEVNHVGGEMNVTSVVDVPYLDEGGTLTGLSGAEHLVVTFVERSDKRVTGTVKTVVDEYSDPSTDMDCDVTFDLAVGWPAKS